MKKICVISGGGSGLGLAIAETLLKSGKNVLILGRDNNKLTRAGKKLNRISESAHASTMVCNIGNEEDVRKAGKFLHDHKIVVEYLFNNAGVGHFAKSETTTAGMIDSVFEANLKAFDNKIDMKLNEWEIKMSQYKGSKIIAYHNEWCYFEQRFGLTIVDFLEPKPGIPPTPTQLVKIISEVKSNNIKVIISSPYFTTSSSDVVSSQTGAKTVILGTSVGAFDGIKDYFDLFEYNIDKIIQGLK